MNLTGRKALIYCRISDEDQSNYSLEDQAALLNEFCKRYQIKVVASFSDDGYSAKSFARPGWKQMLDFAKAHRGAADLLLFKDWSRFSRAENMGETYFQIANLNRLGLEPQAVTQQVDLTIPESYHLLSIYITSPMVENLRRANNIKRGRRRALKTGRWVGRAPFGYKNTRDENNAPVITIEPHSARIIRRIFESYLKGESPVMIIHRAYREGLKVKHNSAFERIILNPLYCGLITVHPWNEEKGETVKGIHEPIISEQLFQLCKSKWLGDTGPRPRVEDDRMPLRGVLRCDHCGQVMTGGRSRGKSGKHWFYYRCLRCKGENHSAIKAHDQVREILNAISFSPAHIEKLIREVDREMKETLAGHREEIVRLRKEFKVLQDKQRSLEEKYIGNTISFEVYEKYDSRFRIEGAELSSRISEIDLDGLDIIELYKAALPKMKNLYLIYETCDLETRQEFLRLIFPGGLFKGKGYNRTPLLNPLFSMKAAADVGLRVEGKTYIGLNATVLADRGRNGNLITPLLEFILRVAA